MSKVFDLSKFELVDTSVLTIQHPKGGDLLAEGDKPVLVTLYGMGSPQYVNAKYKLDAAGQVRSMGMIRNNKTPDPKDVTKSEVDFLTAVTASIENFPVSPAELYANPKLAYIKNQVDEYLAKTENFMPV